jgi:pimeloyl-ACP methyl ester carboxylesterase
MVNGIPIHYALTGSGPRTLCLVHGSGGSALAWIRQLEGLADAARVVALDLPGHGESGGEGCGSIEDYVAAVKGFVEAVGLGRVVLGGHSMGGAVTQALALAHPQLLAGIVLVGTGARLRVLPKVFELMATNYAEGCAFVNAYAFNPATLPALKAGGQAALLRTRPSVTLGDFTACNAFDVMDRVGTIRLPALVIGGEDDQLTPPKYARFLAQAIPGARLRLVDQAGHCVHIEQADTVNAEIRNFLQSLPSKGSD